jgi:hypothetical protein
MASASSALTASTALKPASSTISTARIRSRCVRLVLLFRCRHAYHAAVLITPEIGRKHAQHTLRIEPVRFSPSGAAVDENAGGFKNMADDTMPHQQTVQPEAVTSRFKAADNAYRRIGSTSSTGLHAPELISHI